MGFGVGAIGLASAASSLIGTGISAYSSYQSGKSQKAMANYNAQLSRQNAQNEAESAQENARRSREMNRRQIASVRAKMAGSGVGLSSGSYLDAIGQSASELELQTLDAMRDSKLRQNMYTADAGMQKWQGNQAHTAGKIGAIGTLFTGAARAGSNIYSMKQSGVFRQSSSAPRALNISTGRPY